jgi:hypothetical protein
MKSGNEKFSNLRELQNVSLSPSMMMMIIHLQILCIKVIKIIIIINYTMTVLCCSYRAFSYIPYSFLKKTNKMHQLRYNKIDHKAHFLRSRLLHVSVPRCYHQGVSQQQGFVGPTIISGTIRPNFLDAETCRSLHLM